MTDEPAATAADVLSIPASAAARLVVIGLGQAGARFIRAALAVQAKAPGVAVVAAVDVDADRRAEFARLSIPCFATIAEAAALSPDVAIVTVPEVGHFGALSEVARALPGVRRVLCEKPLTTSAADAWALADLFRDEEISINFVERFSPLIDDVLAFMAEHERVVARAQCWWGKYRVKDVRPTPGVISVEFAHPLDLIMMLGDVEPGAPYALGPAIAMRSDFDVGGDGSLPLDTVHALITFGEFQVSISSSLLWSGRERRIELLLADATGVASEIVTLTFDDPIWDLDRMEIHDVRAVGGRPTRLLKRELSRADWPEELLTIGKVCRFLEANLLELEGARCARLPRLSQGVYVQDVLDAITAAADGAAVSQRVFAPPRVRGGADIRGQVDFLAGLAAQSPAAADTFCWDNPY